MVELSQLQKVGAQFLAERPAAYCADDPGFGKTAESIVAAIIRQTQDLRVICPASLQENWRREIAKFSGGYRFQSVEIMSYEAAAKRVEQAETVDYTIIDEAHYLCNRDAARTVKLLGLGKSAGYLKKSGGTAFLSATPARLHSAQLWPVLFAAMPETIMRNGRPMDYWPFVNRFCTVRNNGFGQEISGSKNSVELRQRLAPYFIRRSKDLLDLPPMRVGVLTVTQKAAARELDKSDTSGTLAAALKDTTGTLLKASNPHVQHMWRALGMAKVAPVLQVVCEELQSRPKVVVFAQHHTVLDALEVGFTDAGFGVARVDGNTGDSVARQAQVDAFQTDPEVRVFLGQTQAAGVGLTLTAADLILLVQPSAVPADNIQAMMRIHRIGQKNACVCLYVALQGTRDEEWSEREAARAADLLAIGF